MRIAYCAVCKPARVIAAGALPDKVRVHPKPGDKRLVERDAPAPRHTVGGQVHEGKLLAVSDDEAIRPGEDAASFFARLEKAYQAKMK